MISIISSRLQTPDGTVLHSKHRHDYVTHTDANGKEYMLEEEELLDYYVTSYIIPPETDAADTDGVPTKKGVS